MPFVGCIVQSAENPGAFNAYAVRLQGAAGVEVPRGPLRALKPLLP